LVDKSEHTTPAPIAYSVPDAAKAIGVSKNAIWEMLRLGELRRVKLGARTLVRHDDLRALIERNTVPPTE